MTKDQARQAGLEQVAWSTVLLLLFFFGIRTLGDRTRPESPALDCGHFTTVDLPALEQCLELRPDDVQIMTDLGGAYEQAAEWGRAEAVYRRSLTIDAEDGDVHTRLGRVLLQRGDREGAKREADLALAVQPGGAAALDLLRRATAVPSNSAPAAVPATAATTGGQR